MNKMNDGLVEHYKRNFDKHELIHETVLEKAHKSIVWKVLIIDDKEYATCSNDKTIKIWSRLQSEPIRTINMNQAVNSIDISYKDEAPYILCSGTFNGSVVLILYETGKIISQLDKAHEGYISSTIVIQQVEELHFATLSFDKVVIWELETAKKLIEIPMGFT